MLSNLSLPPDAVKSAAIPAAEPAPPRAAASLGVAPVDYRRDSRPIWQPGIEMRRAHEEEVPVALRMVLGHDGRPATDAVVADFLRFLAAKGLGFDQLYVALVGKRPAFAAMPLPSPGGTSLLLCPAQLGGGLPPQVAAAAVEQVCRGQRQAGTRLMQALLPPDARELRTILGRCGFQELAELVYLQRNIRRPASQRHLRLPDGFTLLDYSPRTHGLFGQAIARSYVGSLDCPGLGGKRSMREIIAGHKAAGEFHPTWWQVLMQRVGQEDRAVGVLLLAGVGERASAGVELVYLGLAPEVRGRGLGDLLLHHAVNVAHRTPGRAITLAVDGGNAPALKLYRRHDFHRIQTRLALMRDFSE